MASQVISLDEAAGQTWDLVVVGMGVGGGTFGWAMAQRGQRVLFCERGQLPLAGPRDPLTGRYPEEGLPGHQAGQDPASRQALRRAGRDADLIMDSSAGRLRSFLPFIGAGGGGSSALYGMAMERFFPSDFEPGRHHRADEGASLVREWPVSYGDMAPWYDRAEVLYGVRGTRDALRSPFEAAPQLPEPAALTPANDWLQQQLLSEGLHPYRLPMAGGQAPGCQTCQGTLCPRACKNDSFNRCVLPALQHHGACAVENCRVLSLTGSSRLATGVVCEDADGLRRTLRTRAVALAAGALRTPALLLQSASEDWPAGLGNGSGLVGRNLMRHYIDLWALKVPEELQQSLDNRPKQLAFNDLYCRDGEKLGSVQSFGRLPPVPMLQAAMRDDVQFAAGAWAAWGLLAARPVLQPVLRDIEHRRVLLATTVEDLPRAQNRVHLPPAGAPPGSVGMHYRLANTERQRVKRMRIQMAQILRKQSFRLLKQAENNQRIAHACGTCRFGLSAGDSVLNAHNRLHEVDNVWVLDASFFPSSAGTNPSLTIAANALRVAASLAGDPASGPDSI
ncbi:MAG: glucose-methanol-choline oxidoreductase [Burkholderiales bacterium PBB5]|nr:MAG: glucose-methanol-choline oxidoreductase [Burkholderiales bacterium PBB5]